MPKKKRLDFEKHLNEKTILIGLVKICERLLNANGELIETLRVECEGTTVYIKKEDAIPYQYSPSLARLVGAEIKFCVKEIKKDPADYEEPTKVYGSMKLAREVLIAPVLKKLQDGEIMTGRVVTAVQHGAFIAVGDLEGFMKNYDFSEGGEEIRDIYQTGAEIEVKLKKISEETGRVYFLPKERRKSSKKVLRKDVQKGMVMLGEIVNAFPDRVFVKVLPKVDCLCFCPKMGNYREGDNVQVKIQRVFRGDNNKLMVRGDILGKAPQRQVFI